MKRILIVIMSCNQEHFINEEQICKNTYLSRLPDNIDYIIYRGASDKLSFDKHLLKLNVEDDLFNTYRKTYLALNYIHNNFEYDYVFRTNTSTYVNVDLLNSFVQSLEDDNIVWTSELMYDITDDSHCLTLYGRGNGLLLSNANVYHILQEGIGMYFLINRIVDDSGIGCVLNGYRIKNKEPYYDYIKSYKEGWYKSCIDPYTPHQVCNMNNSCKDFDFLKQMITIQIRNWYDRTLEEQHFYEIDEVFKNNKDEDIDNTVKSQYEYSKNPDIFMGHNIGFRIYNDIIKKEEH